ncbi:PAS domain S-box protein [Caproiciproducens sp. NJN-50]|uniref:sigma-54 interaction domain-containing protein n=1 Tax=Acutalibacteraceae TaxID=3082771 RepID=UPI000FFE238E|nr:MULTISPECIES: sigma 54-interacting transcriptional regulator [Acutalibacteraceae]QAT49474.1 PAS domain S-box protein [Caproiciproducens sp. NJN-50]
MKRERVYLNDEDGPGIFRDLKDAQKKLMAIIESSYDGIYITDGNAKTIMVNRSYEVITGLNREEMLGKYMQDLERERVISRSASLIVLKKKEPVTIDQKFKTGRNAIVTSTPLFDKNNEIAMIVTNVRDVSELYDLKEQLAKNHELNRHYQAEIETIKKQIGGYGDLVVRDQKMLELLGMARKVAGLDTTVLLLGETGVGKEVVANYIFRNSRRSKGNFIRVNCAAITPSLVESELFGYVPGAFTGASPNGKIGLFEIADKGTIFLDEIGELSMNIQAKLLRVLQEQEILRIGSDRPVRIDVRVIAATNRHLKEMVGNKSFREDLYYRLSAFPILIPPLRERKEDISVLAEYMLETLNGKYSMHKVFAPDVLEWLLAYEWPGNVRELRNAVERAFIVSGDRRILPEDLPIDPYNKAVVSTEKSDTVLKEIIDGVEKNYIFNAYEKYHNVRDAAKSLHMSAATYERRRKKYLNSV